MKKYFLIFTAFLFLLLCIIIYQSVYFDDKKLHVVFCDVGQGDAILIKTPNDTDILIDGGPDNSILNCLSSHMPIWDRTIEVMAMSHSHADHVNGLINVIERYKVLYFVSGNIDPADLQGENIKKLVEKLKEHNVVRKIMKKGDKIRFKDGVILTTFWPEDEEEFVLNENDKNSFSGIELLTYKNFKALFTGDTKAEILDNLSPEIGDINVLKVPHHGSKTGLDEAILKILKPELAIISVGKGNSYGLPSPFTLELLKNININTLRTDQVGDIEIISDGESWRVK